MGETEESHAIAVSSRKKEIAIGDELNPKEEKKASSVLAERGSKHLRGRERTAARFPCVPMGKARLWTASAGRRLNPPRKRMRRIKEAALERMRTALKNEFEEALA